MYFVGTTLNGFSSLFLKYLWINIHKSRSADLCSHQTPCPSHFWPSVSKGYWFTSKYKQGKDAMFTLLKYWINLSVLRMFGDWLIITHSKIMLKLSHWKFEVKNDTTFPTRWPVWIRRNKGSVEAVGVLIVIVICKSNQRTFTSGLLGTSVIASILTLPPQ